jgi:hypothetical protein
MIYLIFTTSIDLIGCVNNNEDRVARYKDSITKTLSLLPACIQPIIVENNGKRKTFLDDLNVPVHYTNNNFRQFPHKGMKEMLDIQSAMDAFQIKGDDMVIKITGRYHVLNSTFFEFVIQHKDEYDVCMKYFNVCSQQYNDNDCVLGLFAMRAKYLRAFSYHQRNYSVEIQFAEYTHTLQRPIYKCENLHLHCIFSDNLIQIDV